MPPRAFRAGSGAVLVAFLTMAAPPLHAQPSAPDPGAAGAAALSRARDAWAKGEFDVAGRQYQAALEAGGLGPDDVVDVYAHLGAADVVTGKGKAAVEAFRHAALLDPNFTLPPEAGKRAARVAAGVRRAAAKAGPIVLSADVPAKATSGHSIPVDATLDAGHLANVARMGIVARDPLTAHSYVHSESAAASVHFDVPTNMTLPDATLVVRVDALDAYENRLASVEQRVHIAGAATPPPARPADALAKKMNAARGGEDSDKGTTSSGGFWSTAWPWVIGGTLLAAGGAAGYYFGLRPTDDVNVGSVRVH